MSGYGQEGEGHDTYLHEDWELIQDAVEARYTARGEEWPDRFAAMHLRWMLVERRLKRMKPGAFPTVRELAAAWGWKSTSRTAAFVKNVDAWQDPKRRMTLAELRGDRLMGANVHARAMHGTRTEDARDEQTNADNDDAERTDDVRDTDGGQTPCASLPHASTVPPSTVPPEGKDTPPPLDGEADGHGVAGASPPPVELAVLGKAWPAGAQAAWDAFLRWHPTAGKPGRGGRVPVDADRRRLRSAVAELGAAAVVDLVVWAHVSPDERSRWLCGRAPRSTSAFLGLASLLDPAKRGDRIEWVGRWVAAGRPEVAAELQGAPKAGAVTPGAHGLGGYGRDPWAATIVPGAVEQLLLGPENDDAARMVREGLYDRNQAQEARAELRRCLESVIAGERDEHLLRVGLTLGEIAAKRVELDALLHRLDAPARLMALA